MDNVNIVIYNKILNIAKDYFNEIKERVAPDFYTASKLVDIIDGIPSYTKSHNEEVVTVSDFTYSFIRHDVFRILNKFEKMVPARLKFEFNAYDESFDVSSIVKLSVYRFARNGNDLIKRSVNCIPLTDHLYYYCQDQRYYLVTHLNNVAVSITHVSDLLNLKGLTLDRIIARFNGIIACDEYVNKAELMFLHSYSNEMYSRALISRANCLARRQAKEDKERAERARIEAERAKIEAERLEAIRNEKVAKNEKDNAFLAANTDILKSDLTSFERLTALQELRKEFRFNSLNQVCSVIDLIRKHGYSCLDIVVDRFTNAGEKLKTPRRTYYLSNASGGYHIPAKLGKILCLPTTKEAAAAKALSVVGAPVAAPEVTPTPTDQRQGSPDLTLQSSTCEPMELLKNHCSTDNSAVPSHGKYLSEVISFANQHGLQYIQGVPSANKLNIDFELTDYFLSFVYDYKNRHRRAYMVYPDGTRKLLANWLAAIDLLLEHIAQTAIPDCTQLVESSSYASSSGVTPSVTHRQTQYQAYYMRRSLGDTHTHASTFISASPVCRAVHPCSRPGYTHIAHSVPARPPPSI